jgi:hypothetical protein
MLFGRVTRAGDEWQLRLYTQRGKRARLLAVVVGSAAYVQLALTVALGPGALAENRYARSGREAPLVSNKPSNRHSKRSS